MTIAGDRFGKTFNALTGIELRSKILADIQELLMNDDRFQNHIAYPKVGYQFSLTVAVYPQEPATFTLEKKFEGGEAAPGAQPHEIKYEGEHAGIGPNEVRAELGLRVPKPTETARGGVVDFPDEEQAPGQPYLAPAVEPPSREKPLERVLVSGARGDRTEAVEIPGHVTRPREVVIPDRPVVSVTQRTRAAPEGREVDDHVPHNQF